jgi:hypothetical protein
VGVSIAGTQRALFNSSGLTVTGTATATAFSGPLTGAVTGNVTGDVTGNASTATTLQTARTINGTSFNGSSNITVTAAAGTLTGSTLASGVTASSLTSTGTLTSLTVSGDANIGSGTASAAGVQIGPARTVDGDSYVDLVAATGNPDYNLRIIRSSGANGTTIFRHTGTGAFIVNNENAAVFTVQTSGVERMRVTTAGGLLIGTTTETINPASGFSFVDSAQVGIGHVNGTASGTTYLNFNYNGAGIGSITQNGTTAVAYNTTSDYRLKNISGDLQTSGAFIDSLQPKVGTWKADGSPFVGFVAHELQAVSPMSVTGVKDGEQMQSVAYGSAELIANMVAELKSLRARVAALEA